MKRSGPPSAYWEFVAKYEEGEVYESTLDVLRSEPGSATHRAAIAVVASAIAVILSS